MRPSERADPERREPEPDPELVRRLVADGAGERGPCLDANELARLAGGRTMPEERARLEHHVARCEQCQEVLATLLRTPAPLPSAAGRSPSLQRRQALLLSAAGVLALAGIALWLQRQGRTGEGPRGVDARLASAAAELTAIMPELADFRPLSHEERLRPSERIERGGIVVLAPVGTVLDGRPTFRWEPLPGVPEWRVTLLSATGVAAWSEPTSGTELRWPAARTALAEGETYLWEVAGTGPLGAEHAQGGFTVAGGAQRAAFAAADAAIRSRAPPDLRDVLVAHFALRQKLLAAAETPLRERLRAAPDDTLARESLLAVLNALGASEAETLAAIPRPEPGPASRR